MQDRWIICEVAEAWCDKVQCDVKVGSVEFRVLRGRCPKLELGRGCGVQRPQKIVKAPTFQQHHLFTLETNSGEEEYLPRSEIFCVN